MIGAAGPGGAPLIVCDSADFDGTNDSMARGAGLTGAADSKTGILSAWCRLDGGDGANIYILSNSEVGTGVTLFRAAANIFQINGMNTAGTFILQLASTTTYTTAATWLHVLASWNLATASASLYINGVSDLAGGPTLTDDTIDYTKTDCYIGNAFTGTVDWNGCLAEFYFAPGQYLDFSLVANRRKFIDSAGKPVHLGTTGALPTGTAPLVYLHLDDGEAVANFATNRGTGGNFSITGTLDTGSTSPSD